MSTSEASFQSRRPQRLVVAAALAALAVGAGSYGLRSRIALAEPQSATPSYTATPFTSQSVQLRVASADVDFGPGQCEPCVVGLQ